MLGLSRVQNLSWIQIDSFVRVRWRFAHFDSVHFGGLRGAFGKNVGVIVLLFADANLTLDFHIMLNRIVIKVGTIGICKNAHFA